jgi:hypothetical protein
MPKNFTGAVLPKFIQLSPKNSVFQHRDRELELARKEIEALKLALTRALASAVAPAKTTARSSKADPELRRHAMAKINDPKNYPFISVNEAAAILDLSPRQVRNYIPKKLHRARNGKITAASLRKLLEKSD